MRLTHALPLLAALALTACGDDAEEGMTDAALSGDDIAGIEDNGVMPLPGEYATTVELVDFDAPGLDADTVQQARDEFAAGASEPHLYCVTEETTRGTWLSEMVEANCTLSAFSADGNSLEGAMTCNSDQGLNGRVEIGGTSGEQGSDLTMTYSLPTAAGEGTVQMRVQSNATGEPCG